MVILLLFVSVVLFVIADLAVREVTRKMRAKQQRRERDQQRA